MGKESGIRLSDVVAEVESANVLTAVRFEPAFYQKVMGEINTYGSGWSAKAPYVHFLRAHPGAFSAPTVAALLSMSWGLYQILGYNIYYRPLWAGTLWAFLMDPATQKSVFEKFIAGLGKGWKDVLFGTLSRADVLEFARLYNGPANSSEYAKRLGQAYTRLQNAR